MARFKHIANGRDAMLERRKEVGGARDLVDLGGQTADVFGQLRKRTV